MNARSAPRTALEAAEAVNDLHLRRLRAEGRKREIEAQLAYANAECNELELAHQSASHAFARLSNEEHAAGQPPVVQRSSGPACLCATCSAGRKWAN